MASKSALTKAHRDRVYGKYGGKCAFCGDMLGPRWQLWRVVQENGLRVIDASGKAQETAGAHDLPACISCNRTRLNHSRYGKKLLDIETFRQCLYHEFDFLGHHSMCATYYQKALRFGLIQETNNPIVFHFERM